MKSLSKLIAAIAIVGIALSACQKELAPEDGPGPIIFPATNDSIYLHQIVELDSISPTDIDTAYITRFQYDASKRVISRKQYWDDGGGVALMDEDTYIYSGADTLPFFSRSHSYDFGGGTYHKDTTYSYFTYVGGKLVKDSVVYVATHGMSSPTDTAVTVYSYTAMQITTATTTRGGDRFSPGTGGEYLSSDTAALDNRGNVVSTKTYNSNDDGLTWQQLFYSTFTYDAKPSAFSKLSNFRTLSVVPPPESMYYEMQTPNNRTSYHYDYGNGNTQDRNYSGMIYNQYGLLSSFRFLEPGTGNNLVIKYFYRAL